VSENNNSFNIYPNPVTGKLHVKIQKINADMVIYDCIGNSIQRFRLIENETIIDVSNLARGIYYIKVNNSEAQKIVK
jgi:hypothetical protein